jgi:hypothetical protein
MNATNMIEYTIYFPIHAMKDGAVDISSRNDDEMHDFIRELSWSFGGSTTYMGRGNWVDGDILISEKILTIVCIGYPRDEDVIRNMCDKIRVHKNQNAVMYTKRTVDAHFINGV